MGGSNYASKSNVSAKAYSATGNKRKAAKIARSVARVQAKRGKTGGARTEVNRAIARQRRRG